MSTMKQDYAIGVSELDEEHQNLFSLIDDAQTLLKDENILYKYDNLIKILQGLKDYADVHFETEVSLMESLNYPELKEHVEAHDGFCKQVDSFNLDMDTISLGTQDKLIEELLNYLKSWLQIHILDCDRKIALFKTKAAV